MARTPGSQMRVPSKAEILSALRAIVADDATEDTRTSARALVARFD